MNRGYSITNLMNNMLFIFFFFYQENGAVYYSLSGIRAYSVELGGIRQVKGRLQVSHSSLEVEQDEHVYANKKVEKKVKTD